jgi:Phytoene/squalene synthetase
MKRDSLRGPLLRAVSRSFYLSLRFLPRALGDPLSLAYLLARATDTIADTQKPPVALRTEALRKLAAAIQGTAPQEAAAALRESFAPLQDDRAERDLIERLPSLLDWLGDLGVDDRDDVCGVLEKINRGQSSTWIGLVRAARSLRSRTVLSWMNTRIWSPAASGNSGRASVFGT